MCGRFARKSSRQEVAREFQVQHFAGPEPEPHWNVAPSQEVEAILQHHGERRLGPMKWGLATGAAKGPPPINIRSETAPVQPQSRDAFRQRRCLVVADGFFEWHRDGDAKTPYYFHLRSERPFAFAGLWNPSRGEGLATCAILTCRPNELVARIHNRMPVILPPGGRDLWLDPGAGDEELRGLLLPLAAAEMDVYEVSTLVNSYRNDTPECIKPV